MRDVISEEAVEGIRAPGDEGSNAAQIRESLDGQFVCPFCGALGDGPEGICARCGVENSAATRKATKSRVGPWYVYQHRNPAAPGMRFETLLSFVEKGKVRPRSIVRGPTTNQLWRFAAHVKGLSRAFGVCYSCGGGIERMANLCPHCNRLQEPPINPDVLLESDPEASRSPSPAHVEPARPQPRSTSEFRGRDPVQPPSRASEPPRGVDLDEDEVDSRPRIRPAARAAAANLPPRKQAGEDYLSPRELAAAFNLDFKGEAPRRKTESRHAHRPRKPRRIFRKLILLALVGGLGVAIYKGAKPEAREQARQWATDEWHKLQPVLSQKLAALKPRDNSSHPDVKLSTELRSAHSLPAPQAQPVLDNAVEPVQPAKVIVAAQHKDLPSPPAKAADDQASAANAKVEVAAQNPHPPKPAENSKPDDKAASSDTVTQSPAPPAPEMDLATAAEKARSLYNKGIDAEQRVDFNAAVHCYEQIKELPRETWPTDLELRLKLARAQAGLK